MAHQLAMDDNSQKTIFAAAQPTTLRTAQTSHPTTNLHYIPSYTASSSFRHSARLLRQSHVASAGRGVLIGVLSAFASALFVVFILGLIYFLRFTGRGRILLDRIGRPGEFDDEQAFAREEAEALEDMDDLQRAEYMRAKAFVEGNPAESSSTDISLSQFLAIQEKGVSAWEFEPALEIANCFVEGRTEIEFFDTECSVQTNLPVPKQNEVYYWEAKIYDKPDTTIIGIGLTTKPYPVFRMPGYHKTSVAYLSPGVRRFNQPFTPTPTYGPPYVRGDVVGVGYRPRTGTIFFTRNGKKLDDITHTLKTQNLFPTIGATGPATVHVNFGQMGFVYIEANVKKWGLAPASGSLAPPPPYGSEQGSILLDQGQHGIHEGQGGQWSNSTLTPSRHGRTRSAQVRLARNQLQRSPGPERSPTDISLAQFEFESDNGDPTADDTASYSSVQPQVISNLPRPEQQQGLGLLDVNQLPPAYSSPVDRSMVSLTRDKSHRRHPPRTSSRQNPSSASREQRDTRRRRRHRQRQDYFDESSASASPSDPSGSDNEAAAHDDDADINEPWSPYHDQPSPSADRGSHQQSKRRLGKRRQERPAYDTRDRDLERQGAEDTAADGDDEITPRPASASASLARSPPPEERSPPVPYAVAVGESTPGGSWGPSASRTDDG